MSIFAIGDLHLSLGVDKPMNVFGEHWNNHHLKIKKSWESQVGENDLVLLAGDISWAMKLQEAMPDLEFIDNLPGKKVIISGNHDYWWDSSSKLNSMFESIFFLKNDFYRYGDVAICGSRGWICPNDKNFTKQDKKLYNREQIRLKLSLDRAKANGFENIICMMHFPPTSAGETKSEFIEIFKQYGVSKVLYGHLHNEEAFENCIKGQIDGTQYSLVSSDYLGFSVIKILD